MSFFSFFFFCLFFFLFNRKCQKSCYPEHSSQAAGSIFAHTCKFFSAEPKLFSCFLFGFPGLFTPASPLLSLLISWRDRNTYQKHFSETPLFRGFFFWERWCEYSHCFLVISKRGLIVYSISQWLRMTVTSQIMRGRWISICQEVSDFNIHIWHCSYIILNFVSSLL